MRDNSGVVIAERRSPFVSVVVSKQKSHTRVERDSSPHWRLLVVGVSTNPDPDAAAGVPYQCLIVVIQRSPTLKVPVPLSAFKHLAPNATTSSP